MSTRRNGSRATHFAGLHLVGHLATLAFGMLLTRVAFSAVEPAQDRHDSGSSTPMALSASLPPSNTTGLVTLLATNRSTPFAAETRLIAGAAAAYYDAEPLTWVFVVLVVL